MSEEKKQETSAPVEVKEQPKEEIKAEQLARLEEVKGNGIKVCIDFQFEELMIDKELNHLANQAKRVYSSNKACPSPFDLYFINLSKITVLLAGCNIHNISI